MYPTIMAGCAACGILIFAHPDFVPSIRINGEKRAICRGCFAAWNREHRISKGLEPIALHPEAYADLVDGDAYRDD